MRSLVEIDLVAVAANTRRLCELAGEAEVWAVVKADAYGHGAVEVGRAAAAAGAARLCVATLDEAGTLRAALPDVPLIVLSPLAPGEEELIATIGCAVTVATAEGWTALRERPEIDVHIKVDTGMGRWGLAPDEAVAIGNEIASGPRPERLAGLMSHLATADDDPDGFVDQQLAVFRAVAARFPPCPRHLANSAALLRRPDLLFDAVRPGIALFGVDPMGRAATDHGLAPVMRWTSSVRSLRTLPPGASTGYGRRFVADQECRVALVPVGYADGYPRVLSGAADVLIRGVRCRVVANVSMDQLAVLVPDGLTVVGGDEVVLLGSSGDEHVTAEELAQLAGVIPWEILCGVRSASDRGLRLARG